METLVFHLDPNVGQRFDAEYQTVIDWGEDMTSGYAGRYFADQKQLRAGLWEWKPDVVILNGYIWRGALELLFEAKMRGIPVVLRGLLSPYINPRASTMGLSATAASKLWRKVRPFILRRFDAHHYGGTYGQRVLREARVPEDRQYFVPYSVDTPRFAALTEDPEQIAMGEAIRDELGWSKSDPVLLFICQQNWFKGPDVMLEIVKHAQARLPGLKLLMAGSGEMTPDLKAYAAANLAEGSYHFPGYISSLQTVPHYLASDLVVFPSRYDTWSRAVNEAMICRRPCLVSHQVPACGGLVEDGENGMMVHGLDPQEFAGRVVQFFGMGQEERRAWGERARERALHFAYDRHMEAFRHSVTDALGKQKD